MVIIVNDDDAYLAWLEANEDGFLVNAQNPPRPAYLRLHRTVCPHVGSPKRSNWTTTGYLKVCSNIISELEQWASQSVSGTLQPCKLCRPMQATEPLVHVPPKVSNSVAEDLPFANYPYGRRRLLGRPLTGSSRRDYGLYLQQVTGQSNCAYCGMSLIDTYEHWLLLQVDHVVPKTMGIRLQIPTKWLEDCVNLVLACSACNSFANRFDDPAITEAPQSLDEFFDLRNRVFLARKPIIAARQEGERRFYETKPWELT